MATYGEPYYHGVAHFIPVIMADQTFEPPRFFVLAHEIAHNLIPSHDSAHEFWFSAICEARISDFFAAAVSDAS